VLLSFTALSLSACGSDQITGIDAPEIPILENGSFEDGDVLPYHWWRGGPGFGGSILSYDTAGAWEGERCVSISRVTSSSEDFAYWAQTMRFDDFRGGLELRARVRTELSGQGVSIAIRADDKPRPLESDFAEAFATTQGAVPISGSAGWTEHSVRLDRLPNGMKSVTVYLAFLPGTTGSASFDLIELTTSVARGRPGSAGEAPRV
jgi:hypothetical protein